VPLGVCERERGRETAGVYAGESDFASVTVYLQSKCIVQVILCAPGTQNNCDCVGHFGMLV
jgi:hypothetical protein